MVQQISPYSQGTECKSGENKCIAPPYASKHVIQRKSRQQDQTAFHHGFAQAVENRVSHPWNQIHKLGQNGKASLFANDSDDDAKQQEAQCTFFLPSCCTQRQKWNNKAAIPPQGIPCIKFRPIEYGTVDVGEEQHGPCLMRERIIIDPGMEANICMRQKGQEGQKLWGGNQACCDAAKGNMQGKAQLA